MYYNKVRSFFLISEAKSIQKPNILIDTEGKQSLQPQNMPCWDILCPLFLRNKRLKKSLLSPPCLHKGIQIEKSASEREITLT